MRIAAAIAVAIWSIAGPAAAQGPAPESREPPQIPFRVVENFIKLPDNVYMAEVVGVTTDSRGHVFVVNRGSRPLMEFDQNGTFVRSIADGMPLFEGPHNARVDAQDNLWYVDAGTNLRDQVRQGAPDPDGAGAPARAMDLEDPCD